MIPDQLRVWNPERIRSLRLALGQLSLPQGSHLALVTAKMRLQEARAEIDHVLGILFFPFLDCSHQSVVYDLLRAAYIPEASQLLANRATIVAENALAAFRAEQHWTLLRATISDVEGFDTWILVQRPGHQRPVESQMSQ